MNMFLESFQWTHVKPWGKAVQNNKEYKVQLRWTIISVIIDTHEQIYLNTMFGGPL